MNPGLIKSYLAEAAIADYTLTSWGAADRTVRTAVDGSAPLIGATTIVGADNAGDPVDVVRGGLPEVRYGAAVARGDRLTADARGRAVPVGVPGVGETIHYLGYAEVSGVDGDIAPIFIAPGAIKG
ncbi:hypothetical protein GURASL_13560 [Geotalea uraniireducens]|uniref:DUF2190 domain-containing protein n=1 Tax=Geotalea uraniireducens TaxID=351604 RepID=A0ABM8EJ49_9BACT|nr:hypothetical protein [Geotalea uraniireducens]BDV42433.1 hypothetical protein GURASL_13560 [Geotalea uraniireducens]